MNENGQRMVIVDLRIPFVRLMLFFVKAALPPFRLQLSLASC
jgi:hypothetical protein